MKELLNNNSKNIKIEGHKGSYYVIDSLQTMIGKLFLLEHEYYGEESPCIIVDIEGSVVLTGVYDGFNDYYEMIEE